MTAVRWKRGSVLFITSTLLGALTAGVQGGSAPAAASQEKVAPKKTVWDGVYTQAQAARGRAAYELNCAQCHDSGEAPSLVGDAFMRAWFEDSLDVPLRKMRDTMPADAPGSLAVATYVDILSFLLEESGFPGGTGELAPTADLLAGILVVGKGGPGGPVPNFSLVLVVGCLAKGADSSWRLTNATEPVRTREVGDSSPASLKAMESRPLGSHGFRILDVPSPGAGEALVGHKVQAKGFLTRQPDADRLNLTSLQSLGGTCG
jgi:quinoprotein glucose dehydrogenase